ncbi:sensor histidine kinase N-terminal domain-containing protein [Thalassospira alkalitolerans]|uniref:sensor histidine kinase n=1 Tax=Thalassospira alkalitolerans TaxID=1293890 RepID=UPI003AA7B964
MNLGQSIERRILVSAGGFFLILLAVTWFAVTRSAHRAADEAYDRVLGAAALAIADTVEIQDATVFVDIPYSAFSILGTSQLNRIFYRIIAPDGSLVTGSPTLALDTKLPVSAALQFSDSVYRGAQVRVASVGRFREGAGGGGWVNVMVAETREARKMLAAQLAFNALWPAIGAVIVGSALILLAVRRAFFPLRTLEAQIRSRVASDLAPISGNVPREIQALVAALNEFIERLGSTLAGLKMVTADAAHQLRTPLTAVRSLTEVTLDDMPEGPLKRRMRRIHHNSVTASVLANQLLTDATVLHLIEAKSSERCDIDALIRDLLRQKGDMFEKSRISYTPHSAEVWTVGSPVALREMLRNIVDNALVHGKGPVDVTLKQMTDQIEISVADCGPGIPEHERERVFRRFTRGEAVEHAGSGLGLTIAQNVVRALGGQIVLRDRDGGGLVVVIQLPCNAAVAHSAPKSTGRAGIVTMFVSLGLLFGSPMPTQAQAATTLTIASPLTPAQTTPLIESLAQVFPEVTFSYTMIRPTQFAASLQADANRDDQADIVLLPSPDLAVNLANEGLLHQFEKVTPPPSTISEDRPHWRHEVFAVAHDPAVFVVRQGSFAAEDAPRTRLDLARRLEFGDARYVKRVGLVNIGIDTVSYTLATQDELRSPLFWRVAAAFGGAEARIYDSVNRLLDALANDAIDIAYNVPLSAASRAIANGAPIEIIRPDDYVISLPWVVFSPKGVAQPYQAEKVIQFLLSKTTHATLREIHIMAPATAQTYDATVQPVTIGPALLVYLDPLKKSTLLDSWFQSVTAP